MSGLTTSAANRVIDAALGTTALTAFSGACKGRLTTTDPTAAAAGTEVTGGSYVAQTLTFAAASAQSAANSGSTVSYGPMPAVTVNGIDIFDSGGTPFRWWWASHTSGFTQKVTNAGDLLTFAVGTGIVASISS